MSCQSRIQDGWNSSVSCSSGCSQQLELRVEGSGSHPATCISPVKSTGAKNLLGLLKSRDASAGRKRPCWGLQALQADGWRNKGQWGRRRGQRESGDNSSRVWDTEESMLWPCQKEQQEKNSLYFKVSFVINMALFGSHLFPSSLINEMFLRSDISNPFWLTETAFITLVIH